MAHKQIIALSVGGLAVLATVAALGTAPISAAEEATNLVEVTIDDHCLITAGLAGEATFQFSSGAAVGTPKSATAISITCNIASRLTWVAAVDEGESNYVPAAGNHLTSTGMGATGGFNAADGTHALAATANEWGATFSKTDGSGTGAITLVATQTNPQGAPTTAANVATATAGVVDGTVTPTYNVSYAGTLTSGDYYGYVLYSLVTTP